MLNHFQLVPCVSSIQGSQIYDYWHDPFGHQVEHWTDGDQLNRAAGSNKASLISLMSSQWGPTDGRGGKQEPFPQEEASGAAAGGADD